MTKNEFLKALAEKAGITQKQASDFFSATVDVITDTLKNDDKITLIGFGSFELKYRPEHKGVNPKTKAEIIIPDSYTPTFKFSKAYKDLF